MSNESNNEKVRRVAYSLNWYKLNSCALIAALPALQVDLARYISDLSFQQTWNTLEKSYVVSGCNNLIVGNLSRSRNRLKVYPCWRGTGRGEDREVAGISCASTYDGTPKNTAYRQRIHACSHVRENTLNMVSASIVTCNWLTRRNVMIYHLRVVSVTFYADLETGSTKHLRLHHHSKHW